MAFTDNSSITVDMILTKKGRELLSKGEQFFNITQFALADDEIDYRLWNTNHPLGSNYYGEIIDNMPILEAVPDETQVMKYKLITFNKNLAKIPQVQVGQVNNITLEAGGTFIVNPTVSNYATANTILGYTFTTSDKTVVDLAIPTGGSIAVTGLPSVAESSMFSVDRVSHTVLAKSCILKAGYLEKDETATINIYGNETGGSATITVTVKKYIANRT